MAKNRSWSCETPGSSSSDGDGLTIAEAVASSLSAKERNSSKGVCGSRLDEENVPCILSIVGVFHVCVFNALIVRSEDKMK